MKAGVAIGLLGMAACAIAFAVSASADALEHPTTPPAPTPPTPFGGPVPPSGPSPIPPLVLPQLPIPPFPPGALPVPSTLPGLELGASYSFMVETGLSSVQDLTALLADGGWTIQKIHEVIAQNSLRPPFDYAVDVAVWHGDPASETRLAQAMLAGKFLITTLPQKLAAGTVVTP